MPPPRRGGPTKARISFQLRTMAATAASADFAAGLLAGADLIDGTKHVCNPPNYGHNHQCRVCFTKWYGFYPVSANGKTTVEWVKAPVSA